MSIADVSPTAPPPPSAARPTSIDIMRRIRTTQPDGEHLIASLQPINVFNDLTWPSATLPDTTRLDLYFNDTTVFDVSNGLAGLALKAQPSLQALRVTLPDVQLPERPVAEEPRLWRAFKDLTRWLSATDEQVCEMLGIRRTTPYAWKRDGVQPRPSTVRSTLQHHSALGSLRRTVGDERFDLWLHGGAPSRREQLLARGHDDLRAEIDDLIFAGYEPARPIATPEPPGAERPTTHTDLDGWDPSEAQVVTFE